MYLTRLTRLRVPSDDVLDDGGPREDLRSLVKIMERVQHSPTARPTGHKVQVQLGYVPKGCGSRPGESLVHQQGVHSPGRSEIVVLRVDYVPSGTELVDNLMSYIRQCVWHFHPNPAF